jgi:NAD(P)-dependent dehydrogenase (short-subunit alcohol dehydrogenase family)
MIENGGGSIIKIGSKSGEVVNVPVKQAPYNASKVAVNIFTKSIAVEWAEHGIRVNAVAPGFTATDMVNRRPAEDPDTNNIWLSDVPLDRIAEPEKIAGATVYLTSDASSYVTGSVMIVDGGYTAL